MRVKFQKLRIFLWSALILSLAFASWSWFRPYEWSPDPAARCKVEGVQLTQDRTYFWVEVHLVVMPGMTHDLQKPVFLEASTGKKLDPAETTFSGAEGAGTTDVWFKFWMENKDLAGPLTLHLNEGKLSIKANDGIPLKTQYHVSNRW